MITGGSGKLGKEIRKLLRYAGAKVVKKSATADGHVYETQFGGKRYMIFIAAA